MNPARVQQPSGDQIEQLTRALEQAFPAAPELARLVSRLGVSLNVVVGGNTIGQLAFGLVGWAIAYGRLEDLLQYACEHNPTNPALQQYAATFGGQSVSESQRIEALGRLLTDYRFQYDEILGKGGVPPSELLDWIAYVRAQIRRGPALHLNEYLGPGRGRYRLLQQIGQGGFSTVFRAYDSTLRQDVAIKVLHSDKKTTHLERFRLGAHRMMTMQDHPHVAKVLDPDGEYSGFCYHVMEYYPYGDLRQAVRSRSLGTETEKVPFGKKAGLQIVLQAGAALHQAHQRKLIHRDVKPANILIGTDRTARLADFDLVRAEDPVSRMFTEGGLGEYLYAAPEQFVDANRVDLRADVYSLGMTAICVVSGTDPPREPAWRLHPTLNHFHCPDVLKPVLLRAIAHAPEVRFASVGEFCQALDEAMKELRPGDLDSPSDPILLHEILMDVVPNASAQERLLSLLKIPADYVSEWRPWSIVAIEIITLLEQREAGLLELSQAIEALWPGSFERFFAGRRMVQEPSGPTDVTPHGLVDLLCGLLDVQFETVEFRIRHSWPQVQSAGLSQAPQLIRARELVDAVERAGIDLAQVIRLIPQILDGPLQRPVSGGWSDNVYLFDQLSFLTDRLDGFFASSQRPEGMGRLLHLVRTRQLDWLQAETSAIWRSLSQHFGSSWSQTSSWVHELFDPIEQLARRFGGLKPVPPARPGSRRDWQRIVVYRALCETSEIIDQWDVFSEVVFFLDIPRHVIPPPSRPPAARVRGALRCYGAWEADLDVVEVVLLQSLARAIGGNNILAAADGETARLLSSSLEQMDYRAAEAAVTKLRAALQATVADDGARSRAAALLGTIERVIAELTAPWRPAHALVAAERETVDRITRGDLQGWLSHGFVDELYYYLGAPDDTPVSMGNVTLFLTRFCSESWMAQNRAAWSVEELIRRRRSAWRGAPALHGEPAGPQTLLPPPQLVDGLAAIPSDRFDALLSALGIPLAYIPSRGSARRVRAIETVQYCSQFSDGSEALTAALQSVAQNGDGTGPDRP